MAVTATATNRLSSRMSRFTASLSEQNDTVDFDAATAASITIQSTGTIGTAHIKLQGSNNGTTFLALPTAVDLTAVGLHKVVDGNLGFRTYRILVDTAAPDTALVFTVLAQDR